MFSVLKRKFSGDLKARIYPIQKKEISGKMIVWTIHRFLQFLVFEVFYRARISSIPAGKKSGPINAPIQYNNNDSYTNTTVVTIFNDGPFHLQKKPSSENQSLYRIQAILP